MSTTAWRLRQRSLELLDRLVRVTNLVLRLNSGISSRNQTPLFAQADLAADNAWPASYRESASVRSFAAAAPSTGWVANDLPFRAEPASGIVLVLVLRPKGQLRVPDQAHRPGSDGVTALGGWWQVVELWTLPAEPVLVAADPGMMPWVPLMQAAEPPEIVLRRCREVIDQHAPADEHESLITVTQVFTRLRYKDPNLLSILGGKTGSSGDKC